jgi:DNA-directed RNA polymerase subunit M/transcription elongation factor TFIIS
MKCPKCGGECEAIDKGFTLSRGSDANTAHAIRSKQMTKRAEVKVGGTIMKCTKCGAEYQDTPPSIHTAVTEANKLLPKQQTAAVRTHTYNKK